MIVITLRNGKLTARRANLRDICEAVYTLLNLIPAGYVTSYQSIARALGIHQRQVAWCLKNNESIITIPCHRVVYKSLELGGYTSASIDFKRKLLALEGVRFEGDGRVSRRCFIDIGESILKKS